MRLSLFLTAVAMLALLLAGCGGAEEEKRHPFRAGVASVKITPSRTGLYLAGWGNNRAFTKVHDDIYARALVLERGDVRVAWVSLDLLGLMGPDVEKIKERVKTVPASNIVIACSHVHSAPDLIGLWGPEEQTPGVDRDYAEFVRQKTADVIERAARNLRVARVRFARVAAPPGCAINHNDPDMIDNEISILQVVDPADEPRATVVNWACHPECLDSHNLELTSDYVHWLRQVVEAKTEAPCLFFNGALGGMVSPDVKEHSFAEAERLGTVVGKAVVNGLEEAEGPLRPDLAFVSRQVRLPLETPRLKQAFAAGLIVPYRGLKGNTVTADVAVMWLGPSVWMTVPGEPLPAVGATAKGLTDADYKFLVSLANGEFGYILPREFWGRKKYDYEMSMSLGPKTADIILDALRSMLSSPPEWFGPRPQAAQAKPAGETSAQTQARADKTASAPGDKQEKTGKGK